MRFIINFLNTDAASANGSRISSVVKLMFNYLFNIVASIFLYISALSVIVMGIDYATFGNQTYNISYVYDDKYDFLIKDESKQIPSNFKANERMVLPDLIDKSNPGYKFIGWFDMDNNKVDRINYFKDRKDLELRPIIERITYNITYTNLNGANNRNTTSYNIESSDIILESLENEGYTFVGFKLVEQTDETIGLKEPRFIDKIETGSYGNITLEAVWDETIYNISYSNSYDVFENPKTYKVNTKDIRLKDPVRSGYNFVGWFDMNNNRIRVIEEGSLGDISLNAVWSPKSYSITYVNLKGLYNPNIIEYTIETETTILKNLELKHYDFLGFYNGDVKIVEINNNLSGDLVLEAKFRPIEYNIYYTNLKGVNNSNLSKYTIESKEIILNDLDHQAYEFLGFYIDEYLFTKIPEKSSGDITLEAKWVLKSYSITYLNLKGTKNPNPLSYTIDTPVITLQNPSLKGYEFIGFYEGNNKVTKLTNDSYKDIVLEARWKLNLYNITYSNTLLATNNNPITYTIEDEVVLKDPVKTGYNFDGWFNNGLKVESIPKGSIGDFNFEARWSLSHYDITYTNLKGVINNNITKYNIETETIELLDINHPHYEFLGFYIEDTRITSINKGMHGNLVIEAKWKAIDFNITYNNLQGAINNNITKYNIETNTTKLLDVTMEGYVFLGFYNQDQRVTHITNESTGDIILNARWSVIVYNITYENINDLNNPNPSTYTIEDTIVFNAPTKTGYVFAGFYVNDLLISQINAGTKENIVITAKWNLVEYKISYTNIKDSINLNVKTYTIETPTINLEDLDLLSYKFIGFYINDKRITKIALGSHGDITIDAKWQLKEFNVTYTNVKGVVNPNITKFNVETPTTQLIDLELKGYEFLGFFNGENKVTEIKLGSNQSIALEAKWKLITYNVTYLNVTGSVNTNVNTYTVEDRIVLSDPLKTGYEFNGWLIDGFISSGIELGTTGNLTFEAEFSPVVYDISYTNLFGVINSNQTKYTIESNTIILQDILREHYNFLGFYKDDTRVTEIELGTYGNITLEAKWSVKEYSITYTNLFGVVNANLKSYNIESNTTALTDLVRAGYEFVGFYNGETRITEITNGSTGNLVLEAKWRIINYNIVFDNITGATNTNGNTYTVEDQYLFSNPSKTGYKFDGWYNNGFKIDGIVKGTNGNQTITANWSLAEYTITYTNLKNAINNNTTTYTIESNPIVLNDLIEDSFIFLGFYNQDDQKVSVIPTGTNGNITLAAKWQPIDFEIKYTNTIGANNTNPRSYSIEDQIILEELTKEGYTFNGWYINNFKITTINIGSTGNKSFEARWTLIEYQINYINVEGSENLNPSSYTVEDDFMLLDGSKTNYTFTTWLDCNDDPIDKIQPGSMGEITLSAKWGFVGNGSLSNPYIVSNLEQLQWVNNDLNKHYLQITDITITGYFNSIGTNNATSSFNGIYNGNFKRIQFHNIINYQGSFGLFDSTTSEAEIKNLTLTGSIGTKENPHTLVNYGGVVVLNQGTIETVTNEVRGEFVNNGNITIGGIASTNRGSIINSKNFADFTAESRLGNIFAGGITGKLDAGYIENPLNTGRINADSKEISVYVGGIVGKSDGSVIHEPRNEGNITSIAKEAAYAGGLVGYRENITRISSMHAEGAVTNGILSASSTRGNKFEFTNRYVAYEDLPENQGPGPGGERIVGAYYYMVVKYKIGFIPMTKIGWYRFNGQGFDGI